MTTGLTSSNTKNDHSTPQINHPRNKTFPNKNQSSSQIDNTIDDQTNQSKWKTYYRSLIVACTITICLAGWLSWEKNEAIWTILWTTPFGKPMIFICTILMAITVSELIWRTDLVYHYRPIPGLDDDKLPTVSVIVPAFNEGPQVYKTLESIVASDFPKRKFQIVAVDDGSQDDTWHWIQKAKEDLNGRIITIKLARNQGKRHALNAGFKKSSGDVIVTIDSDSIIETDTLRNLVSPIVTDRKVGAVAGNVRVLNKNAGFIPQMLDVVFVYSFDFVRSSQSMVNTVMCTPGALSAYKRSVVIRVLREWLDQTFLGRPANIGEDRALTNLILREGYKVLFQKNAVVYTEVPVNYVNLCKMFLRWNRSNIREMFSMTRFIFKPFRKESMFGARINLLLGWLTLVKAPIMIVLTWSLIAWEPLTFLPNLLLSVVIFSSLPAGFYGWKYSSFNSFWSYFYGFYSFIGLAWVMPYSLLTPHNSGWLTREIKPKTQFKMFSFKQNGPAIFQTHNSNEVQM
ncbi:MAG: glycosyltransferase [Desulfobacteraceae bacterium]|jgi:hyaluronan synthase